MQKQEREGDKNLSDNHKREVESSSTTMNQLKIAIYDEKGIFQFHIQVILLNFVQRKSSQSLHKVHFQLTCPS